MKNKITFTDKIVVATTDKVIGGTILKLIPESVNPNQITIFRFITIPLIVILLYIEYYYIALLLFTISALSDAVDGALARARNKITEWGIIYDAVADKLLVSASGIILILKYLNWPLLVLILIPEILILINVCYRTYKIKKFTIQHNIAGKVKMTLQCAGIIFLLLYAIFLAPLLIIISQYILYGAVVFGFISIFVYKELVNTR